MDPISLTADLAAIAAVLMAGEAVATRQRARRVLGEYGSGSGVDAHGLLGADAFALALVAEINRAQRDRSAVSVRIGQVEAGDPDGVSRDVAERLEMPERGFRLGPSLVATVRPLVDLAVEGDQLIRWIDHQPSGDVAWVEVIAPRDARDPDTVLDRAFAELAVMRRAA